MKGCLMRYAPTGFLALFLLLLAGCGQIPQFQTSAPIPGKTTASRYDFSSHRDPERGEVVKIFDQQTGDYWIKWVGTDHGSGKIYSIWNYFPLKGEPKSGLTEIRTMTALQPDMPQNEHLEDTEDTEHLPSPEAPEPMEASEPLD